MNWYVLQVYSGYEKQILEAIEEIVKKKGLESKIKEIFVPTQDVLQVRYGKKSSVKKRLITGYMFINMDLDDNLLHVIKNIPRVSGFIGSTDKDGFPFPVSQAEIDKMVSYADSQNSNMANNVMNFDIGEEISIIHGPFASFKGTIEEIDEEKAKIKVAVSIFGRMTPVELEYIQVEKIKG